MVSAARLRLGLLGCRCVRRCVARRAVEQGCKQFACSVPPGPGSRLMILPAPLCLPRHRQDDGERVQLQPSKGPLLVVDLFVSPLPPAMAQLSPSRASPAVCEQGAALGPTRRGTALCFPPSTCAQQVCCGFLLAFYWHTPVAPHRPPSSKTRCTRGWSRGIRTTRRSRKPWRTLNSVSRPRNVSTLCGVLEKQTSVPTTQARRPAQTPPQRPRPPRPLRAIE